MIERYAQLNRILRAIVRRAWDFLEEYQYDEHSHVLGTICSYINRDIRDLERLWPPELSTTSLTLLREIASKGEHDNFRALVDEVVPTVEDALDAFFSQQPTGDIRTGVLDLLHPIVIESSYHQFRNGLYRDAVLNAIVAVFDLIRRRTGIDRDGADLAGEVFSLSKPLLTITALDTESGRNDQKGFIQLVQGAYLGIRNPKAHSLLSDLTQDSAAQYLVFASLLARRVSEAKNVNGEDAN